MSYRTIWLVFKVLAASMILVFVFDISAYLIKAYTLHQRMNNLATSIQRVVMENNYLPYSEYKLFDAISKDICLSLNGINKNEANKTHRESSSRNNFIICEHPSIGDGIKINAYYDTNGNPVTKSKYLNGSSAPSDIRFNINGSAKIVFSSSKGRYVNLAEPAEYGDCKYIELVANIIQPMWGFRGGEVKSTNLTNNSRDSRFTNPVTTISVGYLVPCLHYNAFK